MCLTHFLCQLIIKRLKSCKVCGFQGGGGRRRGMHICAHLRYSLVNVQRRETSEFCFCFVFFLLRNWQRRRCLVRNWQRVSSEERMRLTNYWGRDFGTSKVICINSLAVKYQGFKRYEQSHSLPKQRVNSMWTCRVSTA